jgi:hypothetical protein
MRHGQLWDVAGLVGLIAAVMLAATGDWAPVLAIVTLLVLLLVLLLVWRNSACRPNRATFARLRSDRVPD